MTATLFQFGEFELDRERFELRRNGRPLRLERKPMELLILLIASEGRLITRAEIAERLWDREVFVDTEHGINTAIRKIRQALREDPEDPRFLQTVTGKGYRFIGVVAIFPELPPSATIAAAAAGSFAPTSVAAPATETPLRSSRSLHRTVWLGILSAAALAILVVAFTLGTRRVAGRTAKSAISSLAVLPLDNLTGDPSRNYLADGMTDELTTQLARDSSLRVISRTSVMQYKDAHRPLPEIARSLGVDGIVEGSLTRSGQDFHVTLQLINAPIDTHLWAESYDRTPGDLLSLPDEAARTIAAQTHSAVASPTPQRYVSPAAHDAYLRGRYLWFSGHDLQSGPYFIKATQLQPDYALAWFGLSSYYGAAAVVGELDPRQALPLAKAAALRTSQIDPSLPESHFITGTTYWLGDWNLDAALNEFARATDLDPRFTEAWHLRSKVLIQDNRFDEGLAAQRHAMEINQFERPWAMAYALLMTRHFDAAIAEATQRLEADPGNSNLEGILFSAYRGKGMDSEAEHALERSMILDGQSSEVDALHRAFAAGGMHAALLWLLSDMKSQAKTGYVSPMEFAALYAQLGDKQKAFLWLEEAMRQHSPSLLDLQNEASFDPLHADPRYRALVQKIGLPPAR